MTKQQKRDARSSRTSVVTTHTGPQGYGTYTHYCLNTTYCALAGGIGDGCGGSTDYMAIEAIGLFDNTERATDNGTSK